MVLEYHSLYNVKFRKNGDRILLKIHGSGWNTRDFFQEFFVINEAKYVQAQKYTEVDVKQLSLQDLDHTCFAFNGINQVNFF
jgi:hypothetical protein